MKEADFSYPSTQPTWSEVNPAPFPNNGDIEDDQAALDAYYAAREGDNNA